MNRIEAIKYINKNKCSGLSYMQCIPYKGNEHLNGKKDDCDKYFKTWE